MKLHATTTIALLGALAFACTSPAATDSDKLDPAFAKFVLSAIPADVPNPTFVDFGGKVHLVGYEIPSRAAPDTTVSLKLYWRSANKLPRGYQLYTHLTEPSGKVYEFDDVGPLRQTVSNSEFGKVPRLPPSEWIVGMVYVDEQTFAVPITDAKELALSVGVKSETYAPDAGELEKVGEVKLAVLSGVADGKGGTLLARLATGVTRGSKPKRPDRQPGLPLGRGPKGRMPVLEREIPQ